MLFQLKVHSHHNRKEERMKTLAVLVMLVIFISPAWGISPVEFEEKYERLDYASITEISEPGTVKGVRTTYYYRTREKNLAYLSGQMLSIKREIVEKDPCAWIVQVWDIDPGGGWEWIPAYCIEIINKIPKIVWSNPRYRCLLPQKEV